ncbi:App1 family protein [Fodinibius sp.]|uniref:App1 family protein n=1 Tax=Fodinibius sp. TaxID=1872440 RepID=UPI00356761B2
MSKLRLGKKLGFIRSVMIMPYHGFGNGKELFFLGRVLKDRGISISQLEDSKWRNFKRMYKRFMTWEIPDARVEATFDGITNSATTDDEGYFEFRIELPQPIISQNPWQKVRLVLADKVINGQKPPVVYNDVYIPSENVGFGVISDIDDTIVPTGATKLWDMLKTTFLGNAHTRVPFPGVAAFYQALSKGLVGRENNPFFYVSSSPWNLYGFLRELMNTHNLPQGPLMLRDIGLSREYFLAGSHIKHKLVQIERVFDIISDIPFILVGDSGQHDAEIYLQVIKNFPGRVKMVYIRDVDPSSHTKVLKIADEIRKLDVEMMLVSDTIEAAHHAVSKGWILEEDIAHIGEEKKEDENLTGSLT